MDPRASTSEGQFNSPAVAPGPKMSIQWQSETALTDALVNYLTTHSPECRILFYSEGKKKMVDADDNPMSKDKGDVHGAIAKLLFANHIKYGAVYDQNQKKFRNSVSNQISALRTKYKKHKTRFNATGTGVMPLDGQSVQNLLELIHADFLWYSDLDSIWHNNPSMVAKTYLSQPGVDHAAALYSLVQPHGRAGPSIQFGATAGAGSSIPAAQSSCAYPPPNMCPPPNTYLPPSAYPPTPSVNEPSNANVPMRLPRMSGLPPSAYLPPSACPPPTSSINELSNANVPERLPRTPGLPPGAYLPPNAYPAPNEFLPPNAFPPPNTYPGTSPRPPLHLPRLFNSPDVNICDDFGPGDDDDLYSEGAGPFSAPLGNALEHLDNDEMMDHDGGALESPP
ncbi:hypothetical protein F4604DRAFT_1919541 [Suillus subluteus]|nr:hypothetical protein F4604DRAFT_1919541 [Suillus subluteus]